MKALVRDSMVVSVSTRRFRPLNAVLVISVAALATSASAQSGGLDVRSLIEPIRAQHGVPALGAALVTTRGIVASGVTGLRKVNTDVQATIDDKWHLGSDTKAMTAVVIAALVERGKLRWETTLGEVFPDLIAASRKEFRAITVTQLLSHHSGLPRNGVLDNVRSGPSVPEQRLKVLQLAASKKLDSPPGKRVQYSNLGYVLAGAVAERISGQSWEDLMPEIVFKPLGMTSCGFGGVGTPGTVDQPWPHTENGKPTAANGPAVDNPLRLGPAGTVHCSIGDWSKFIADQLRGALGESALLKADTYKVLHTAPYGDKAALGWGVDSQEWAGGTILSHSGSNGMNESLVRILPMRGFAVLAVSNQGGARATKAVSEATLALSRLHGKQ